MFIVTLVTVSIGGSAQASILHPPRRIIAASLSPDGEYVYYIESVYRVHSHTSFSDFWKGVKSIPGGGTTITFLKVNEDKLAIRRVRIKTGNDELVRRLPAPPWIGATFRPGWPSENGAGEGGTLGWSKEGELQFTVSGHAMGKKNGRWVDGQDQEYCLTTASDQWKRVPPCVFERKEILSAGTQELIVTPDSSVLILDHKERKIVLSISGKGTLTDDGAGYSYYRACYWSRKCAP